MVKSQVGVELAKQNKRNNKRPFFHTQKKKGRKEKVGC